MADINIRHIFYSLFFIATLLSCKNTTLTTPVQQVAGVMADSKQEDHIFIYTEVSGLKRSPDYSTANKVQKLDLIYQSLSIKIRYISDRAYITVDNAHRSSGWQPLKINFYYDMSFADAEQDIRLLLKDNNITEGYLLFPAFTEQYASYFVYYFSANLLRYLGNYEAENFKQGPISFNEQTKIFYRSSDKASQLTKIKEMDQAGLDTMAEDIKLLEEHNLKGNSVKEITISNEWLGVYDGSFLRLKEEPADPRAWGTINLKVAKESVKFHLYSYSENVAKELNIVFADAKKIRFVALDNDKQGLTLLLDKNKYKLSGILIEEIVGVRETYELEKN